VLAHKLDAFKFRQHEETEDEPDKTRGGGMKFAGLLLSAMLAIGAAAPKTEPQKKAEFTEPEGFSVYKWGTPPEVITGDYSAHPDRRSGEERRPREKFFRASHAVGNIDLAVEFIFLDGGLAAVVFTYDRDRFDDLRLVFLEKYGRPTLVDGKFMFWIGKKSSVSLSAGGGGHVATNEYLVYNEERKKEQTKKGVKDL
jgi:hypothetical protein